VSVASDDHVERYRTDSGFRARLSDWMRNEQGWELPEEQPALRENLGRAARLSCYTSLNRLVFYELLRRRLRTLPAPAGLQPQTGAELSEALRRAFRNAVEASRDYETVFAASDLGA